MDKILYDYLMSFVGTPYIWGGSNGNGIDCSGLIIEAMKSMGVLPLHYDGTAKNLFDYFTANGNPEEIPSPGAIAFFGRNNLLISHTAIVLDHFRMIEAGGGDPTIKSREDANLRNAFVRIRPIKSRSDLIGFLKPSYVNKVEIPQANS